MRVRSQSQNIRISVIYLELDPALSLQDCGYTLHSTPRCSTQYTVPGLAVSSAKRKLPEETAEEMEGKKHFLPWKKRKKRKKLNKILSYKYFCTNLLQYSSKRPTTAI